MRVLQKQLYNPAFNADDWFTEDILLCESDLDDLLYVQVLLRLRTEREKWEYIHSLVPACSDFALKLVLRLNKRLKLKDTGELRKFHDNLFLKESA